MTRVTAALPDLNVMDVDALRALVIEKHAALISHQDEIESLQLLILKLKRSKRTVNHV